MELKILYQDEYILAVDKPSGILVHRGWAQDTVVLTDLVMGCLNCSFVYPLHRLDRQTSGIVLFALSKHAASLFSNFFSEGLVAKIYLALVRGITPNFGIVDHPIPRKENGPRVNSLTEYVNFFHLETFPRYSSLILARPHTGRLHQIRRHLKHISHPIIGDANYGKGDINRAFKANYGLDRMALHALSISFPHPTSSKRICLNSPLPHDLLLPFTNMGYLEKSLFDVYEGFSFSKNL